MITVHHLNASRSQRILWLLEELGVSYELRKYERHPLTMLAPPELKKIHPLGKSPVVVDEGKTYAESGAIIEHLLDKYGKGRFRPEPSSPDFETYRFFMHYAEGSVMPPLLAALLFNKTTKPPTPFFIRPFAKLIEAGMRQKFIVPQMNLHFDFLEKELEGKDWLLGHELSAADFQMSFAVEAGESRAGYQNRPNLQKYLARMRARPAYQLAHQKAG